MQFATLIKALVLPITLLLAACGNEVGGPGENEVMATPLIWAGAASASILPTVGGTHDYIDRAGAITAPVDPVSPGVYVDAFDQGQIDIDNGKSDAAWVHDDIRATALALQTGERHIILFAADVYLITAEDGNEIIRRAREALQGDWRAAEILFGTTHNHHGPGTIFSVNDAWYEMMANQIVGAIVKAVDGIEPAALAIASGDHRFGVNDVRDPVIIDPEAHVLHLTRVRDGSTIATAVQWNSHVESTLTWAPPVDGLESICEQRGWEECTAEGRYITSDYPGELRGQLEESLGGEVLYFVGAIGNQIGPGEAPVWQITSDHPLGDGWTVPEGAAPIRGATGYLDKNFVKAEAIGEALATHVEELVARAVRIREPSLVWREEAFYSRLHQRGFAALAATGNLAWQGQTLYLCDGTPSDETCRSDEGQIVEDTVAGPMRTGDYVKSRVGHLSLGKGASMLFMPGEIPPEMLIGLPQGFDKDASPWYRAPVGNHARGSDYQFPGYIESLMSDDFIMAIGLGNDQLGYWVPPADVRVTCAGDLVGGDGTCASLHEAGIIAWPKEMSGRRCKKIVDDGGAPAGTLPEIAQALEATCRYGLMLGKLYGYTDGHYEETNNAGWDLVEDSWEAWRQLFPDGQPQRINPDLVGYTPQNPP